MKRHNWLLWAGLAISLGLVGWLLYNLDWALFWAALRGLEPGWVAAAAACVITGVMARALRWNLLAGLPLAAFSHFWRAASLGYLGNLIYPARAGEFVRMAAINRFAKAPAGLAVTSAVMDRVADGLMLGLMTLWVASRHSPGALGQAALVSVVGAFGLAGLLVGVFLIWGERGAAFLPRLTGWLPQTLRTRLLQGYTQAWAGAQPLRQPARLGLVALLTAGIFGLDYAGFWLLFRAFGWNLPLTAAVTTGVFIGAGSSLPSAPGYVGIYQAACVLALGLYQIDASQAVAYSIVVQMLQAVIICAQGVAALLSYGLRWSDLSQAAQQKKPPAPAE